MEPVVIVGAARTPIGSFKGSLSTVPVHGLASVAIRGALSQAGVSGREVDEVYMGQVLPAGQGGLSLNRALMDAGVPSSVPCTTLNKRCASGLKAIMVAAQSIRCGDRQVAVAGGMESMSQVPFYMARGPTPYGGLKLDDGLERDGLRDSLCGGGLMGEIAEKTASRMGVNRADQDEFAMRSYARAQMAEGEGAFNNELTFVEVPSKRGDPVVVEKDEEFHRYDLFKLRQLKPVFKADGTITAGNASNLSDGAAALVLMGEKAAQDRGLQPLAQIVGYTDAALDPDEFPSASAAAVQQLLRQFELSKDDVALWEINEAFSVVALANMRLLDLHPDKVNIHGGAVSMGHPLGMSGARITGHLVHSLQTHQLGVATVCNGGGGASAILLQGL